MRYVLAFLITVGWATLAGAEPPKPAAPKAIKITELEAAKADAAIAKKRAAALKAQAEFDAAVAPLDAELARICKAHGLDPKGLWRDFAFDVDKGEIALRPSEDPSKPPEKKAEAPAPPKPIVKSTAKGPDSKS